MALLCTRRPVVAMASPVVDDEKPNNNPFRAVTSFVKQIRDVVYDARAELTESAAARLLCIALLHPLDAAKTRVQATGATSRAAVNIAMKGTWFGGLSSQWYGGLPAALIGNLPHGVIAFSLFAVLQRRLAKRFEKVAPRVRTVISACAADAVAALWLGPAEIIKVRVQTGVSASSRAAATTGRLGTGILAQIFRDMPCRALYLVLYDEIRERAQRRAGHKLGNVESIGVAATVGATVGAITTPVDVIRSRIMAQHPSAGKLYNNWLHCLLRTVRQEGLTSVYRGVLPRTVYMAASVALFTVSIDQFRRVADANGWFETARTDKKIDRFL